MRKVTVQMSEDLVRALKIRAAEEFTTIAAIVFALIALLQLLRFVLAWPVSINGVVVPVWASAVAFVIAAGLSVMLWREGRT